VEEEVVTRNKPEPSSPLDLNLPPEPKPIRWLRITYRREDSARFLSVLEIFAMWDKALRRAGLRPNYSQGFNPRRGISLGPALPVGVSGLDEIVDIAFPEGISLSLITALTLPKGISISSATELTEKPISPDKALEREIFMIKPVEGEPLGLNTYQQLVAQLAGLELLPGELIRWKVLDDRLELVIGRDTAGRAPNLRRVLRNLGTAGEAISLWEVTRTTSLAMLGGKEHPLHQVQR